VMMMMMMVVVVVVVVVVVMMMMMIGKAMGTAKTMAKAMVMVMINMGMIAFAGDHSFLPSLLPPLCPSLFSSLLSAPSPSLLPLPFHSSPFPSPFCCEALRAEARPHVHARAPLMGPKGYGAGMRREEAGHQNSALLWWLLPVSPFSSFYVCSFTRFPLSSRLISMFIYMSVLKFLQPATMHISTHTRPSIHPKHIPTHHFLPRTSVRLPAPVRHHLRLPLRRVSPPPL